MFRAYCKTEMETMPAVSLEGPEQIWSYLNLHKHTFPYIVVEDNDNYLVANAVKGRIVFPPHMALLEMKSILIDPSRSSKPFSGEKFMEELVYREFSPEGEPPADEIEALELLHALYEKLPQPGR